MSPLFLCIASIVKDKRLRTLGVLHWGKSIDISLGHQLQRILDPSVFCASCLSMRVCVSVYVCLYVCVCVCVSVCVCEGWCALDNKQHLCSKNSTRIIYDYFIDYPSPLLVQPGNCGCNLATSWNFVFIAIYSVCVFDEKYEIKYFL